MSYVAAAVTLASVVASISYQAASAPGKPGTPDLAQSSRAGALAEADLLGIRREIEAAAQQGKPGLKNVSEQDLSRADLHRVIQGIEAQMTKIGAKSDDFGRLKEQRQTLLRQIAKIPPGGTAKVYSLNGTYISPDLATADFSGYGEADVQGKIAQQNAQNILDLQKKYGPQFIAEALAEQKLADPQGAAARERMYDLIQEQADAHPERPVAELLDQQVGEQLKAGSGLDKVGDQVLRQAVGQAQASRGQAPGDAEQFAEPLTTGFEGEARREAGQQKALGWLTSGATPEDVQYRREQQTLADLSSAINNRTPESQFASLSGAQQGPAPYYQGRPLPQANQATGPAAGAAATQGWNMQLSALQNQADPWMAGLSALIRGAGAATNVSNPGQH